MWSWILDLFSWEMPREPEYFSCERTAKPPYQILEEHEDFILELQEGKEKQAKYEIVLWWGLDGLKLNDDGTTEWISRRKPKPINQDVSYQPCQSQDDSIRRLLDMCQSRKSPTEALNMTLASLQMRSAQTAQNMALCSMLQNALMPYDRYPALMQNYGTVNLACVPNSMIYSSTMTNCCYSPCLSAKIER